MGEKILQAEKDIHVRFSEVDAMGVVLLLVHRLQVTVYATSLRRCSSLQRVNLLKVRQ